MKTKLLIISALLSAACWSKADVYFPRLQDSPIYQYNYQQQLLKNQQQAIDLQRSQLELQQKQYQEQQQQQYPQQIDRPLFDMYPPRLEW